MFSFFGTGSNAGRWYVKAMSGGQIPQEKLHDGWVIPKLYQAPRLLNVRPVDINVRFLGCFLAAENLFCGCLQCPVKSRAASSREIIYPAGFLRI